MSRGRGTAVATVLLLAALAAAGCGLGPGGGVGSVRLTVTREFGAVPMLERSLDAGEADTVMRLLEGNADLCILATFASADAFKAYSTHQAHMDVIFPALGHHMARYATAQFEA